MTAAMIHQGPALRTKVPVDVSLWEWLFETSTRRPGRGFQTLIGGFRDANTGGFKSYTSIRNDAILVSRALTSFHHIQPAVFAAVRLGAVVCPLNPDSSVQELSYYFGKIHPKAIFADTSNVDAVHRACTANGAATDKIFSLDDSNAKTPSVQGLVKQGKNCGDALGVNEAICRLGESNQTSCAFLCFSSGTTGLPKAVMISQRNVILQIVQMYELGHPRPLRVLLGILPFYHITGLIHLLHLPIILDQEVVIMANFTMASMLRAIVVYHCEELWLVPPLLMRLLDDEEVDPQDLACVRQFNTGAAPLAQGIIDRLADKYPYVAIRQAWGMTETCSCVTVTPWNMMKYEKAHLVGKIVSGTTVKVVDPDTGYELGRGMAGELWVSGPQVTMGYKDNPEATKATYASDGYLRTGDIGLVRDDGFVIIHDRIKEMIKIKGNAVAPAELEEHLLKHLNVQDVAVIGVPHKYSGEVPAAFVVLRTGVQPTPEVVRDLQKHVEDHKTRYKHLVGGIRFVERIPKSASGKILRRILRGQWPGDKVKPSRL